MGVDKFFLQSIYGDVVDWAAAKDSSNVSPEYEVVEMFRKIEFLFDRYYSTDDRSQSRHQILHDDVCKLLASEADSHLTYPSKKARKAIADLEERSIDDLELLGRIGRVVGF